jgi:small GTP-binding protein
MDIKIKILALGDINAGKTSSLISYSTNSYPEEYVPTVIDNNEVNVDYESKEIKLSLWDTSGGEEFDKLRRICYKETNIFMIHFDVSNMNSLINIKKTWIPEINKYCPGVPFIIVGNKIDLRDDKELQKKGKKMVSYEEGINFSNKNGASEYCECSAKTSEGLKTVYESAIKIYFEKNIKKKEKKKFFLF